MTIEVPFESFEKISRLKRNIVITEKIDGSNAQIFITDNDLFYVGSRNKWITPDDDNFGFARWAYDNEAELHKLGYGRHYGEWWGSGIQRRYGLNEKRFSLFNTGRWTAENKPACCHLVPVLYQGPMTTEAIDGCLAKLAAEGSSAAPGFMDPEGVIIYHVASRMLFKQTIKDDSEPKRKA